MERGDYWSAIVRGWWLIVIFGLVGLAVGFLLPKSSHVGQTIWVSTSSFGSAPPAPTGASTLFGGGISTDQIAYYANTDAVMASTSQLSGLNEAIWAVRAAISITGPPSGPSSAQSSGEPGVINVKVLGPTSAQALALNDAYDKAMEFQVAAVASQALNSAETKTEMTLAKVMNEIATNKYAPGLTPAALQVQLTKLQDYLATLVVQQPDSGFQVLQAPSTTTTTKVIKSSFLHSRTVRGAAGLLIGLILGALAALAIWLLDKRLKTAKRAQVAFGYPVVAEIPSDSSDSTEPYRKLWLSVFREPLPLPPAEQDERLYQEEDPVLDLGAGTRSRG